MIPVGAVAVRALHDRAQGLLPARDGEVGVLDVQARVDPRLAQRVGPAGHLLAGRLGEPFAGGEADAAVPELEQVLGREAPGGALVDADRGDGERLGAAVHEDEPRAPVEQLPVVRMLAADIGHLGADEEHPVDPALEQHLHVVDLAHRRAGGVAEDRGEAGAGRVGLHRLRERGEDRVRELGHEQADRTRRLGAAGGHVEELAHRALDALAGLRAHRRGAADDPGGGGDANSRPLRDVSKAGGLHWWHRHGISVFTRRKHFQTEVSYRTIA